MTQPTSTSIPRKLALAAVPLALALAALTAGGAGASEPQPFSFEKDCTGANPFCVIHHASAPFTFLNGMVVTYDGPGNPGHMVGDLAYLSQEVTIGPSADVDLATGHFRWLGTRGSWTIRHGVGLLAGFHATGAMSFVGCVGETCTYALTGSYHVDP
jgi:hypothetical protein